MCLFFLSFYIYIENDDDVENDVNVVVDEDGSLLMCASACVCMCGLSAYIKVWALVCIRIN